MGEQLLPQFKGARGGSGCDNPDCDASNRHIRVLSELETDRMYPRKDSLPQWPFPPMATHACEKCGYCYQGVAGQLELSTGGDDGPAPSVDIGEYDFDPDEVFGMTVRAAIESLIEGRPDGTDMDEVKQAVRQHVPGAGPQDAEDVAMDMGLDAAQPKAHEFM